jgi:hypothetical protein
MERAMTEKDQQQEQLKSPSGAQSPMAMGMGMAKKMMAQMGQGGSPFEMMQKMMAQMSEAGKPPGMDKMMGMCMGMCSEMLNAIRQTNALAVHGTPELQQAFEEWLKGIDAKAEALIAKGPQTSAALAKALKVSEASANYLLARLAQRDKITLVAQKKG